MAGSFHQSCVEPGSVVDFGCLGERPRAVAFLLACLSFLGAECPFVLRCQASLSTGHMIGGRGFEQNVVRVSVRWVETCIAIIYLYPICFCKPR